MKARTFTIIVPVYNESDLLPELLRRMEIARTTSVCDSRLVIVDDGSTDDSRTFLRDLPAKPWISYHALEQRSGQHHAIIAGFRSALHRADTDIFGTMDADMDPGPEEFDSLLPHIHYHDLVIGRRIHRRRSFFRSVVTFVLRLLCLCIRPTRIRDHGSMFRVYRSDLVRRMVDHSIHGVFVAGLSLLCARSPAEVPVYTSESGIRPSRYSLSSISRAALQMLRLILHHPLGAGVRESCISRTHRHGKIV